MEEHPQPQTNLLSLKNRMEELGLGMLAPYPMEIVISILYFPILYFPILPLGFGFMADFHLLF